MIGGRRVLAVVPARSGSKGIPDKNLQAIGDTTLLGLAGDILALADFVDARVLTTDSERYAEEGRRHGLEAPFVRPRHLSTDEASAVQTCQHAVLEAERGARSTFDVILIVEPTSPMRTVADLRAALELLVAKGADSVVTVSPLSEKAHPMKLLRSDGEALAFVHPEGAGVTVRQQLEGAFWWRNGLCYALTRECLMEQGTIFTPRTLPLVVTRAVANIDTPVELEWARFLFGRADPRHAGG